jgi:hypothetical protein
MAATSIKETEMSGKLVLENDKFRLYEDSPVSGYIEYKDPKDVFSDAYQAVSAELKAAFRKLDEEDKRLENAKGHRLPPSTNPPTP